MIAQLRRVVADLEYLPGWSFHVSGGGYDLPRVHLRIETVDADTGAPMVAQFVEEFAPLEGGWPDRLVALAIWRLVMRAHRHEAGESFRWRGERIADPHRSRETDDRLPMDAATVLAGGP